MNKFNKIVVMPVRNEEWILEKSLSVISLFADHIIVADHNSTDKTPEILKKFDKVKVIKNDSEFHSSGIRKVLLDEARKIEGNNIILSFDADEVPTPDILKPEFWEEVEKMEPGSAIEMQWISLWRGTDIYRNDDSIWGNSYKAFGFVDDRKCEYVTKANDYDHVSRVPLAAQEKAKRFEFPKVLHYQFINWERVLLKQARYRVVEFLQSTQNFITAFKINVRYYAYKEEEGVMAEKLPDAWYSEYQQKGIDLHDFPSEKLSWYEADMLKFFKTNGPAYFKWLDIWDFDWEKRRQAALEMGIEGIPESPIADPRPVWVKLYHNYAQGLFSYKSIFYKTYRLCIKFIK